MTQDESIALNAKIYDIADDEGLSHNRHGKAIPYIGWCWRDVDFTQPISFGDCGDFVGFMENNKWGYPDFTLTPEQDAEAKAMLVGVGAEPTYARCREFWDRVQTYRPSDLERVPERLSLFEQMTGLALRTGGAS